MNGAGMSTARADICTGYRTGQAGTGTGTRNLHA